MIRACLLILLGGLAAQHSRLPISSDLCKLLIVAAVGLIFIRRARPEGSAGSVRYVAFVLLGFALFMHAGQDSLENRLDSQFSGDSMLARVRVLDFPKVNGDSVTMTIAPVADSRLPDRSRVSWFEATQVPAIGEVWELELRLRRPRGNSNPGGFDLEAWLFREKLYATGYVVNGKRNRLLQAAPLSWRNAVRAQYVLRAKANSATPEAAAVLSAVGVGTRHLITRQQWDRYAATGTSHLMAISGLHVGLAAAAATLIFGALSGGLRLPGNHLIHAILAGAIVASMYAFISGLAVPSQRAIIMLLFAAAAFVRSRRIDPGRIVAISAVIVFVLDPVSSMSPGFTLSFSAVVVLLFFALRLSRPDNVASRLSRAINTLCQLIGMQGVLLFGLLPLTVITFNRIAIFAPVVNLLVVPVFSFVTVPAALGAMSLSAVSTTANSGLLQLAALSIAGIDATITRFAALPMANITPAAITGYAWGMLLLVLLWVILPRQWPGRWIAIIALVAIMLHQPSVPKPSCFDTHVLDVGQGLAAVIQTNRHALIFDTGAAYRSGGSAAEQIVLPFLLHKGIRRVSWLVVSHADNDHAGGVNALAKRLDDADIIVGEALPISMTTTFCTAGQVWRVDNVEFRVLHPAPGDPRRGNDASCVVDVRVGEHHLLLTGDIEALAEERLVGREELMPVDVVVIPHHGSSTSSTPAFINAIQADIAIASAGYRNRWGFPKPQIVKRWQGAGARVFSTANSGAVSFRLCAKGGISRLRQHRTEEYRFWREGVG